MATATASKQHLWQAIVGVVLAVLAVGGMVALCVISADKDSSAQPNSQIDVLFDLIDVNSNGVISREEFMNAISSGQLKAPAVGTSIPTGAPMRRLADGPPETEFVADATGPEQAQADAQADATSTWSKMLARAQRMNTVAKAPASVAEF